MENFIQALLFGELSLATTAFISSFIYLLIIQERLDGFVAIEFLQSILSGPFMVGFIVLVLLYPNILLVIEISIVWILWTNYLFNNIVRVREELSKKEN